MLKHVQTLCCICSTPRFYCSNEDIKYGFNFKLLRDKTIKAIHFFDTNVISKSTLVNKSILASGCSSRGSSACTQWSAGEYMGNDHGRNWSKNEEPEREEMAGKAERRVSGKKWKDWSGRSAHHRVDDNQGI